MDINELKGNSNKSKQKANPNSPKLQSHDISVKTKKQSKASKFAKSVIAEDAKSVGNYILMDVLIPALRKLIVDVVENGITALVYGQNAPVKKSSYSVQKVPYNSLYNGSTIARTKAQVLHNRSVYEIDDIIFSNRGDAEMILEDLKDAISRDRDGFVSVGDLRDACKLPTTSTDWNYGWTDLGSAEVSRTSDGYVINFPRITRLD